MGRIVCLDYGTVWIGVAISDPRKIIATPLKRIAMQKALDKTFQELLILLDPYKNDVEMILIGLPLLLSGKDSDMTTQVRKFAEELQKKVVFPVKLWDERLTSSMAERSLKDRAFSRRERKDKVDMLAAVYILQSYLESL